MFVALNLQKQKIRYTVTSEITLLNKPRSGRKLRIITVCHALPHFIKSAELYLKRLEISVYRLQKGTSRYTIIYGFKVSSWHCLRNTFSAKRTAGRNFTEFSLQKAI